MVRARRRLLPVVLPQEQVARVVAAMPEGLPELMACPLPGAGMRLMECLRQWIKDVDVARRETPRASVPGEPGTYRKRASREEAAPCGALNLPAAPCPAPRPCPRWSPAARRPSARC